MPDQPPTAARPTGTVTFLFTDIEQSTRRWEEQPEAMRAALARHDAVLRQAIEQNGGWLFKHTGDGVIAAFAVGESAIDAAIAAQRQLDLPVRMAICTGEVEARGDDYFGPALNRAQRTMAAGHGGQILVTASTAAIVSDVDLADLGEHRLRDLAQPQRVYQLRAAGLRASFPPLNTLDPAPGNLPVPATAILGRDADIAEVAALLRAGRLLTLTGVGGVGKTRLALQVATDLSGGYPDGTWMVELAAIGEPEALGHAVAAVLHIAQQAGQSIEQSIVAALRGRRLLLLLDNCEHLIEAAAALAHQIAAQCPRVSVLATSREALGVDGERIWPVPSLDVREGGRSPAVALFAERAQAIVPSFTLAADEQAVADICQHLDGIPLAIELAAARVRIMSPAQILARLNERFRLLTGGSRRALERHQTLRHAVQWSFDLLSPEERAVLNRTAVFAGGFSLDAAERVCCDSAVEPGDLVDLLDSLVRKSMMTVERSGQVLRYGLLETIRQFADEQLVVGNEADDARRRHAAYFADDSDAHFRAWRSPRQTLAYAWLDREFDNLRAAFRWAATNGDIDVAARIASNIGDMARFRQREEAAGWAAEIVDAARQAQHRRLAVLLTWAASSAWGFGHVDDAKRFGEEAAALADSAAFDPFVWCFTDLAMVAAFEGQAESAINLARAGAAHPSDRHDRFCLALLPYFLAAAGQHDEAVAAADSTLATVKAMGIPMTTAIAYYAKGRANSLSDVPAALAAYGRAATLAAQSGDRLWEAMAVLEMTALRAREGDPVAALHGFGRMIEAARGATDTMFMWNGLGSLIQLLHRLDHVEAAVTLFGALCQMFASSTVDRELNEAMDRRRAALGDAKFDGMTRRGAAMAVRETVDYAAAEIGAALVALGAEAT